MISVATVYDRRTFSALIERRYRVGSQRLPLQLIDLRNADAGGEMFIDPINQRWNLRLASLDHVRATRMESATHRRIHRRGRIAR